MEKNLEEEVGRGGRKEWRKEGQGEGSGGGRRERRKERVEKGRTGRKI
jgi:hypothetical protein